MSIPIEFIMKIAEAEKHLPPTPFKIRSLSLDNFRCFEKLEVNFHEKITVIVSENGGGKTSITDAIALCLGKYIHEFSNADQRLKIPKISDDEIRRIKKGKTYEAAPFCDSQIYFVFGKHYHWLRSLKASGKNGHSTNPLSPINLAELPKNLAENKQYLPAIAYYGCQRGAKEKTPQRIRDRGNNYENFRSAYIGCLNPKPDFCEFAQWFEWFEGDELRGKKEKIEFRNSLEAVRQALETFYSSSDVSYRNPRFKMRPRIFKIDKISNGSVEELPFDFLSDGYRMMTALVMDFSRRLCQFHLDLSPVEALSAPGLMIIDEVDLHLHPSWQQRVIPDLMRTFPGTQFIVTTHSPQVLSTVHKESIRVLTIENNIGHAVEPEFNPYGRDSSEALNRVQFVPTRAEDLRIDTGEKLLDILHQYEALVRNGEKNSTEAINVRAKIDEARYDIPQVDMARWEFLSSRKPQPSR